MRWLLLLTLLLTPVYPQEGGGESESQLYLSLNIDDGARLQLSDGTTYEIAPEDRLYSAYWITPFPLTIGASGDPDYPISITNLNSRRSVRGKKIDTEAFLQRESEKEKRLEKDAQKEKSLQPPPSTEQKTPQTSPPKKQSPPPNKGQTQSQKQTPPATQPPSQSPSTKTPQQKPKVKPSEDQTVSQQEHFNR